MESHKMILSSEKIYLGELNHTALGNFRIAASDLGLLAVEWADSQIELDSYLSRLKRPVEINQKMIQPYAKELGEYIKGKLHEFTFPIDWSSLKPFQMEAMKIVYAIPYGETRTYADVAVQMNRPNAYRAVGRANAT